MEEGGALRIKRGNGVPGSATRATGAKEVSGYRCSSLGGTQRKLKLR